MASPSVIARTVVVISRVFKEKRQQIQGNTPSVAASATGTQYGVQMIKCDGGRRKTKDGSLGRGGCFEISKENFVNPMRSLLPLKSIL
jgi:hypothetical protein